MHKRLFHRQMLVADGRYVVLKERLLERLHRIWFDGAGQIDAGELGSEGFPEPSNCEGIVLVGQGFVHNAHRDSPPGQGRTA